MELPGVGCHEPNNIQIVSVQSEQKLVREMGPKCWQWYEAIDAHRLCELVARNHLGLDHKQPGEVKTHNALFSKFLRGAMKKQADKYRTR